MGERLDRDAVSRILDRAHAIEQGRPAGTDDGIEPDTLVEAAAEVGFDPNAVRDSMAIERLSIEPRPPARFDGLVGPARLVVERELVITVPAAIAGLEVWLTSVHKMRCDRRSDSRLLARRRSDASAQIGRSIAGLTGDGRLGGVASIDVEATSLIVGSSPQRPRTIVRVSVDRTTPRTLFLGGGGVVALAGAGSGAGAAAAGELLSPWPLVSLPLIGGGYLIARSGRGRSQRLELELERLLSAVGRGETPTGLVARMVRRVRRTSNRAGR